MSYSKNGGTNFLDGRSMESRSFSESNDNKDEERKSPVITSEEIAAQTQAFLSGGGSIKKMERSVTAIELGHQRISDDAQA